MKLICYRSIIDMLITEGYLKGEDSIKKIKFTHGNCCTCQTCGQDHDECVCEHNRLLNFIKKMPTFNIAV